MTRKRIVMTALAAAASIGVLGACTPEEVQTWQAWRAQDPAAADAHVQGMTTQPEPAAVPARSTDQSVWDKLAYCESGGNWAINLGSGYYGGLQMLGATWRAYGGTEFAPTADQATREQQIVVAGRILDDVGWGAWPACSRQLGLR
jgi:resuscitation-promoting factor RpfA